VPRGASKPFLDGLHRQRIVDNEHAGKRGDQSNRFEISHRIERQFLVQAGRDRVAHVREQPRVAVGPRTCDDFTGDDAASAGPVVRHDLLPQIFPRMLRESARQNISGAPGRRHHDHADGPRGINGLCQRCVGQRQSESPCGERGRTGDFHCISWFGMEGTEVAEGMGAIENSSMAGVPHRIK
jgi:hypothetical protein